MCLQIICPVIRSLPAIFHVLEFVLKSIQLLFKLFNKQFNNKCDFFFVLISGVIIILCHSTYTVSKELSHTNPVLITAVVFQSNIMFIY